MAQALPIIESKPRPLELFKQLADPVMMLSLFNENIRTRKTTLYTWQIQRLVEFAAKPGKMSVVANNGSGKSTYLIAPAATWLAGRFKRGLSVVTSSSGPQLDRQTGSAAKHIAEQVNAFYDGEEIFKIRERDLTFMPHGGKVLMFATDEAGKAEGYHPDPDGDGEMGIFVDEGKSITEDIYGALARCTGCSRRLDVSSPGSPQGHFFDCFTNPTWNSYRITYKDTPHITEDMYEEAVLRYGEFSPLVRSMFWAEFVGLDDQIVIHYDLVKRAFQNYYNVVSRKFGKCFAGVDLSGGGDEQVLSVWHGNTEVGLEVFREKHASDIVAKLVRLFRQYDLSSDSIVLDDGGLGKILNDYLVDAGYSGIKRVRNEGRAIDVARFGNRGAENWHNFARILDKLVFTKRDSTMRSQLGNRYYKDSKGKMMLEDKRKAKVLGHRSPDRADACVLAFVGKWDNYLMGYGNDEQVATRHIVPERMTQTELIALMDKQKYEKAFGEVLVTPSKRLGRNNFREVLAQREELSQYIRR